MLARPGKHRFWCQREDPKTIHHDSKSPRYGGISQLPRTWSSGCLSVFPPALINIDLGTNGRTQKHAQRQQIAPLQWDFAFPGDSSDGGLRLSTDGPDFIATRRTAPLPPNLSNDRQPTSEERTGGMREAIESAQGLAPLQACKIP